MAWDRNSSRYPRAVAQFDRTACWAASLEWWLRCMHQSRRVRNQLDLISEFVEHWDSNEDSPSYGTITGEGLGAIMRDRSIRMHYVVRASGTWSGSFVNEKLPISPVIIAYNEEEVGGFHLAVIHSINDGDTADVNVMDPNRGRYRTRSHRHFTNRNYILGWATT